MTIFTANAASQEPPKRTAQAVAEGWQVLEEEFEAQHGALDDDFAVFKLQREARMAMLPIEKPRKSTPRWSVKAVLQWLRPEPNEPNSSSTTDGGGSVGSRSIPPDEPGKAGVEEPDPERAFRTAMHLKARKRERRAALCMSGGGIRSASFNLGVLQLLGRWKLLDQFDFLSTVSGGGYIGSWLSAWIYNEPAGLADVTAKLTGTGTPDTIVGLRGFSRFLSPRTGLLSADTWALVSTYLRNLVLNWIVFAPLLIAALLVPRLVLAVTEGTRELLKAASSESMWAATGSQSLLLLAGASSAWAFAYAALSQPSTYVFLREVMRTEVKATETGAFRRFMTFCLCPLCVSAVLLSIYNRLDLRSTPDWKVLATAAVLVGILAYPLSLGLSRATASKTSGRMFITSTLAFVVAGLLIGFSQTLPDWMRPVAFTTVIGAFGGCLVLIYIPSRANALKALLAAVSGVVAGALFLLGQWNLTVPRLSDLLHLDAGTATILYTVLAFPVALLSFSGGGAVYIGLVSKFDDSWDGDREWWARFGAWVLIASLAWLGVFAMVLLGPLLLFKAQSLMSALSVTSLTGAAGLVALLLGTGPGTHATDEGAEQSITTRIKSLAAKIAAPVFLVLVFVALSLLCSWLFWEVPWLRPTNLSNACRFDEHALVTITSGTAWHMLLAVMGGLITISLVAGWRIDLNRFSMHALYRDRLVRAFLGVSNAHHDPDAFTQFDGRDNIYLSKMGPGMFRTRDLLVANSGERVLIEGLRDACEQLTHPVIDTANHGGSIQNGRRAELFKQLAACLSERVRVALQGFTPAPVSTVREVVDEINRLIASFDLTDGLGSVPKTEKEREERGYRLGTSDVVRNAAWLEANLTKCFDTDRRERSKVMRPMLIVNAALNLVNSKKPSMQDRKAGPFTFSPLHSGSWKLGFRDTQHYGGPRGVSLGTAMTISGAAVSPNQGYNSSPVITFLLALFNIRLGLWLGNPGPAGDKTWRDHAPKTGFVPPIMEAFGLTDDEHKYVYLSDGGHFDNLGLYEMIRRRCHDIIVIDAGADPTCNFTDLGNAIRKVGIDTEVPINLISAPMRIHARSKTRTPDLDAPYAALFEINYQAADGDGAVLGRLLYIKPCVYWREPPEVLSYALASPTFPHESTINQFYSEAQMDSYRRLAIHELDWLCNAQPPPGNGPAPMPHHNNPNVGPSGAGHHSFQPSYPDSLDDLFCRAQQVLGAPPDGSRDQSLMDTDSARRRNATEEAY